MAQPWGLFGISEAGCPERKGDAGTVFLSGRGTWCLCSGHWGRSAGTKAHLRRGRRHHLGFLLCLDTSPTDASTGKMAENSSTRMTVCTGSMMRFFTALPLAITRYALP